MAVCVNRLAEIVGVSSPHVIIPYKLAYLTGWIMEKIYGMLPWELGYEPKVGFDEGMRRVEVWLQSDIF